MRTTRKAPGEIVDVSKETFTPKVHVLAPQPLEVPETPEDLLRIGAVRVVVESHAKVRAAGERIVAEKIAEEDAARRARQGAPVVTQVQQTETVTDDGARVVKETPVTGGAELARGIRTVQVLATDELHATRTTTQTPASAEDEAIARWRDDDRWRDKLTE